MRVQRRAMGPGPLRPRCSRSALLGALAAFGAFTQSADIAASPVHAAGRASDSFRRAQDASDAFREAQQTYVVPVVSIAVEGEMSVDSTIYTKFTTPTYNGGCDDGGTTSTQMSLSPGPDRVVSPEQGWPPLGHLQPERSDHPHQRLDLPTTASQSSGPNTGRPVIFIVDTTAPIGSVAYTNGYNTSRSSCGLV